MEEDIKVLEKLQKVFAELRKDDEKGHSSAYELQWEDIQAIENLIIENNHLKEHLQKYYNGELYTAKQLKNIEENQRKYFIHKSKVKEKIEGAIEELYEEMEELDSYDEDDNEEKRELTDMIVLLKELQEELLQEGDK